MEQSVSLEQEPGETEQRRLVRVKQRFLHPIGRVSVSTAEFETIDPLERVDPLSGILDPRHRKIMAAEASRSFLRRVVDWYGARRRAANEPNIGTYETELIVDEEELRQPLPPLPPQVKRRMERGAAAFEGHDPRKVNTEPLGPFFGSTPGKQNEQ